jgi:hypothetical protein
MSQLTSLEGEGTIFNRGAEKGPIYGVRGIVGIDGLRKHVWDSYPRDDRRAVVEELDKMLKVIEGVARNGVVVRGKNSIDPLDSLRGKSPDLDTDLDEKGLIVMPVIDINNRYRLNLTRDKGFHPKIWMSIAGPHLRRGLHHELNKGVLEMSYNNEPNFDKTITGLAGNVDNHFGNNLPPDLRQPFPGVEIVNLQLYELSQITRQSRR